jgi:hypothetical protein
MTQDRPDYEQLHKKVRQAQVDVQTLQELIDDLSADAPAEACRAYAEAAARIQWSARLLDARLQRGVGSFTSGMPRPGRPRRFDS